MVSFQVTVAQWTIFPPVLSHSPYLLHPSSTFSCFPFFPFHCFVSPSALPPSLTHAVPNSPFHFFKEISLLFFLYQHFSNSWLPTLAGTSFNQKLVEFFLFTHSHFYSLFLLHKHYKWWKTVEQARKELGRKILLKKKEATGSRVSRSYLS